MYSTIILPAAFFQLGSALFTPEREIVFCAADVFQCPGVDDIFLSRDPSNNCEFNFDECPQVQPKPEILCSADTFECPGVNDMFLTRDPSNNCEFNFDECPQVQPRPGPPIINEQIEFRVQPGFCRTADLGAGMPKRLRLNRAQCQQECELDKSCTAYEYRNTLVCEIHSTPAITQVVPAPDDSVCGLKLNYIRFEGYCHTEENPAIIMKRAQGRTACEEECTSDPKCVGYEYASEPTDLDCELHFSKLVSIAPAFDGSTCDVIEFLHPGFPFF